MFQEITYTLIFGKPLIFYMGIVTILAFFLAAFIAILNKKGIHTVPFKWHPRCAALALCLAVFHGMLGILAYF